MRADGPPPPPPPPTPWSPNSTATRTRPSTHDASASRSPVTRAEQHGDAVSRTPSASRRFALDATPRPFAEFRRGQQSPARGAASGTAPVGTEVVHDALDGRSRIVLRAVVGREREVQETEAVRNRSRHGTTSSTSSTPRSVGPQTRACAELVGHFWCDGFGCRGCGRLAAWAWWSSVGGGRVW